jgi:hypothetical protein
MTKDIKNLKQRILDEMSVSYANALEKNFELAKQFIRVTSEGRVEVLMREQLNGKQQILLYLIGKLYSKEAGLTPAESAGNKELTEELGIPMGSLLPWLKDLRDQNRIKAVKTGYHQVSVNLIEKTLKEIEKKLNKS